MPINKQSTNFCDLILTQGNFVWVKSQTIWEVNLIAQINMDVFKQLPHLPI